MASQNTIKVAGDGNITIQDVAAGSITINTYNPDDITKKLKELNDTQLSSLLQLVDQQNEQLSGLFIRLLKETASKKHKTRLPKELTLTLPKTHPDDIIGRENDLDELHTLLQTQKRVVVVNGLGGIGKTTLAQAYLHKYYDDYHHIAWITQGSDNLAAEFLNTAGLLENLGIDTAQAEPDAIMAEIFRKLKGVPDTPNLLTIDNAEASVK
ncbi:hypothetical protein GCM10023187_03370 [Nibrella viscosa]|uniref:Orc1-like AAA ATPase domain-containing protein n=1 Tax=Nibrella viscosa TaxID=1084524 RepID=A0ABP8JTG6_9BACT